MISPARVRRGIEVGLVVLVALMPFHAFFSVWLGSLTGHEAAIQIWKELLLAIMAAGGVYLAVRVPELRDRLRTWPVLLAGLFAIIALVVTMATRPSITAIAFGAKTDLEFLLAFVIAVIVATPQLIRQLTWAILLSATVVISFGILQFTILPPGFLVHFGYGPATVLPYEKLDSTVRSLRFASTLGGPNQLGTYLLVPMALAAIIALRRHRWWLLALPALGSIVLIHTYSRAAWLGALASIVVLALVMAPSRLRGMLSAAIAALMLIAVLVVEFLLKTGNNLQHYIFHSATQSDSEHLHSLQEGIDRTLAQPLGHGLGTAGPAVFHSGQGLIIENNYLQISYETGMIGALLFIAIIASLGVELVRRSRKHDLAAATLAALIGICVTALFLPAWVDSSTALIFWTAAGGVIGVTPESRHV